MGQILTIFYQNDEVFNNENQKTNNLQTSLLNQNYTDNVTRQTQENGKYQNLTQL